METTASHSGGNTELVQEETKSPKIIKFKAKIKNKVKWKEDVIDNENMGKKKSKSKF